MKKLRTAVNRFEKILTAMKKRDGHKTLSSSKNPQKGSHT